MSLRPPMFRSRVARRVLLLYILSALVPTLTLAVVAYLTVATQLRVQGRERLRLNAKTTGMAVIERLRQLSSELGGLANTASVAGPTVTTTPPGRFSRLWLVQNDTVTGLRGPPPEHAPPISPPHADHLASGGSILEELRTPDGVAVLMARRVPSGGTVWGEIDPVFLWAGGDPDAAAPPNTQLCFMASGEPLSCNLHGGLTPSVAALADSASRIGRVVTAALAGERHFVAAWPVFLGFAFGHDDWTVVLAESDQSVLRPIADFRRSFPMIVVLTVLVVTFLSNIQIRRSLGPLRLLAEGTRRLSLGRFDQPVHVSSGDEFQDLAGSFNAMAASLGRQFRALTTMSEIDQAALSGATRDDLMASVLERFPVAAGCDQIGVAFATPALDGRWACVARDVTSGEVGSGEVAPSAELIDDLRDAPNGIRIEDGSAAARLLPGLAADRIAARRFAMFPLLLDHRPAGVLAAGFPPARFPDAELTGQIRGIADQVALALSNARLVAQLGDLSWGTLTALARTIDAKSPWTAGHSERVTELAVGTGRRLGFSDGDLDRLHRGGLLHDIGKIGVDARILDKPERLTEPETAAMQQHVRHGARILTPIAAYQDIIPIVLYHHERFDGSGYPEGLAGAGIPLLARVLAVADCYDALHSDRPYRRGLGVGARQFVLDGAGTMFDPAIVDAFLDLLDHERPTAAQLEAPAHAE